MLYLLICVTRCSEPGILPSSVFTFFHFLLSSIFSIMSSVTDGLIIRILLFCPKVFIAFSLIASLSVTQREFVSACGTAVIRQVRDACSRAPHSSKLWGCCTVVQSTFSETLLNLPNSKSRCERLVLTCFLEERHIRNMTQIFQENKWLKLFGYYLTSLRIKLTV